jgi:hypothetical protein
MTALGRAPVWSSVLACAFVAVAPIGDVSGQQSGELVYQRASESVFLLEISDAGGAVTGTATGFLIASDQLVTNAHVAVGGR